MTEEMLDELKTMAASYRIASDVSDVEFLEFLRIARHEDSKLPLGRALTVDLIARRAKFTLSTVFACLQRARDCELIYQRNGEPDTNFYIEHQDVDFAVSQLERRESSVASTRRKHDKFGILDSPSHYAEDFPVSIGILGIAVLYFDLDNFKAINTRFTEPVVDQTLLSKLNTLIAELAKGRGIAYAEGGDEFIVMLPNTNAALAEVFATVLLETIRARKFLVDGEYVNITASAGIALSTKPHDGQRCREAAARAKKQAKDLGRDRFITCPS